jgi:hypothetical protein
VIKTRGLTWNIFEKILYIIPILSHNVNYNSYWSDTCLLHLMWFCILSRELLVYICFVEKFHSPSYKTMLQPLYCHTWGLYADSSNDENAFITESCVDFNKKECTADTRLIDPCSCSKYFIVSYAK